MDQLAGSSDKGTSFSETRIIQCGSKQLDLSEPVAMGILNVSPDSFYDGDKYKSLKDLLIRAEQMISQGAAIIDIGAVSTRPGATHVKISEEKARLYPILSSLLDRFTEVIISVDTWRSEIARECCDMGAGIINDISGGQFEPAILDVMGKQKAAYVLMHIKGTPQTMQENPVYTDVCAEINDFFIEQLSMPGLKGKQNIMLDPGFGFGKTVNDNYRLLNGLPRFQIHGFPLLAGLSRKSMVNRILGTNPGDALNGTSVLNTIALLNGASILRVHDVKEAVEVIKLIGALKQSVLKS